ncbi:spermidine resistance protein [Allomyces arbusculus]|nr:spermidine resistance protein [Allomyces arbusculus]
MSFEGAEKLLEVWFHEGPSTVHDHGDADAIIDGPAQKKRRTECGLRAIDRDTWQTMLNVVKCQILSVISNAHADAYLLSESSLFVFPNRIILKTCGTTTLLLALPHIMELASQRGFAVIDKLFYSRKCFQFPDKQQWPHNSWDDEVDILDGMFANGASYVLGKTNADHWYLYVAGEQMVPAVEKICPESRALIVPETADPIEGAVPVVANPPDLLACVASRAESRCGSREGSRAMTPELPATDMDDVVSQTSSSISTRVVCGKCAGEVVEDRTMEMLMTGLDEAQMRAYFYNDSDAQQAKLGNGSINHVEKLTGLDSLIPECTSDSFLFEPCGWSQNALRGQYYSTFHVTPEPSCSYASFETNIPLVSDMNHTDAHNDGDVADDGHAFPVLTYKDVAMQVLNVFQPTNVTLTHFSNAVVVDPSPMPPSLPVLALDGYRLVDITINVLPHYHLFYAHYVREDKHGRVVPAPVGPARGRRARLAESGLVAPVAPVVANGAVVGGSSSAGSLV